jgi:hypothetical protein
MFGFLLILVHILTYKSTEGLSYHTFVCYSVSVAAKLLSHLFFDGYLPIDSTGDHFLQIIEIFSLLICTGEIFHLIHSRCRDNKKPVHARPLEAPVEAG